MGVDLAAAERFVTTHGRILDRHRCARLLRPDEPGVGAQVLAALDAHRNLDGGYGWGLEPDLRDRTSQPSRRARHRRHHTSNRVSTGAFERPHRRFDKVLFNARPPRSAHTSAHFRIIDQPRQCRGQLFWLLFIHQQTRYPIHHGQRIAGHRRSDHRFATTHGIQHAHI